VVAGEVVVDLLVGFLELLTPVEVEVEVDILTMLQEVADRASLS
jgi:hypothetical protein